MNNWDRIKASSNLDDLQNFVEAVAKRAAIKTAGFYFFVFCTLHIVVCFFIGLCYLMK